MPTAGGESELGRTEPADGSSRTDDPRHPRTVLGRSREFVRRDVRRWLERWPVQLGAILAEIVLFSAIWTAIDWQRYLTLHFEVFDFGLNVRDIWTATSGPFVSEHMIANLFVLAYWAFPSQPNFFLFLFVLQNVTLFLGAIPLYLLVRARCQDGIAGLALASAYILFTPLTGVVWSPFHFEGLFPVLFLTGYWLYRTDRYVLAGVAFVLSALTNIGAPLLVAALGAGVILEPLLASLLSRARHRRSEIRIHRAKAMFALFLIAGSVAILLLILFGQGTPSTVGLVERSASPSTGAISITWSPFGTAAPKAGFLVLAFGPLLFLPIWGREERWPLALYLIPALLTVNSVFLDPWHDQYGSLLVPVAFAATVRAYEELTARRGDRGGTTSSALRSTRWDGPSRPWVLRSSERVPGVILTCVVLTFLVFSPLGPLNPTIQPASGLGFGRYNLSQYTSGNVTLDRQILAMVAAVPSSGPALIEDNLPELFERNGAQVPGCFVLGDPLEYVITDPYDASFLTTYHYPPSCTANVSMFDWANYFLGQRWGVLAEADGAVALAANLSGAPQVYYPAIDWYPADDFSSALGPGEYVWNRTGSGVLVSGPGEAPWGGSALLFPGTFWVNLTLNVSHPTPSDWLTWTLAPANATGPSFNVTAGGGPWSNTSGVVHESVVIRVPSYELDPRFSLYVGQWSGRLRFDGVSICESAPP